MPRPFLSLGALLCAVCCFSSTAVAADLDALAARNWIKVDSPHFSVITEQAEATARQVVSDLEAMRHFKIEVLGERPLTVARPLTILAIGEENTFVKLGLPKTWGGVFHLGLDGYSAVANITNYEGESSTNSRARATLLHEYHHFLVRLTEQTLAYPRWLDEGMAEYWSTFNVDGAKVRVGDRVSEGGYGREVGLFNGIGRAAIDTQELFNTVELPVRSFYDDDQRRVGRFYSSAYFAVHYFNSTPVLRSALASYIRMINLGYRQDRAAALAFKKSYAELNSEILAYAKKGVAVRMMTGIKEAFSFPKVNPTITRLDTPALYASLARILPTYLTARTSIEDLLTKNRQLNPQDADANVLPLVYGLIANHQVAIAELEKRFPKHPMLLTYQGEVLRLRAEHMFDTGASGWLPLIKQARDYYRLAIAADPGYPAAYLGLGRVYRTMPAGEPLEEAVAGFDAASIYTRKAETFSSLASTYMRMNRPMDALPALRSALAFDTLPTHNSDPLLLDNLEMLDDLSGRAKASSDGLAFAGGTHYTGPVSNDKPEGMGKLTRENGSYYEGNFVQGLPSGIGKLVSDSGLVYHGEFERGFARGKGELTYPAGGEIISYTGLFEYMKPFGRGVLVTRTGRYTGDFNEGRRHGMGEFTSAGKPVTLRGRWLSGAFEWPAADGIVFIGAVSANGLRHGKGMCRATQAGEPSVPCEFNEDARIVGALSPGAF